MDIINGIDTVLLVSIIWHCNIAQLNIRAIVRHHVRGHICSRRDAVCVASCWLEDQR